jgi:hypothetical protein
MSYTKRIWSADELETAGLEGGEVGADRSIALDCEAGEPEITVSGAEWFDILVFLLL